MAQPRSYSQTTTFTDHSTVAPNDPHSGANLDTEFVEIKQNLDDLNSNIALLQRDDGKLLNTAVHKDAFDQDALAFIGASGSGFSPKGAWTGLKTTVEITTFASDGGSPAKSIITKSNHGLADNTIVRLSSSGTLPTGFLTTEDYYVVSSTTTTFKLSGTSGGTPINFTDAGSGTHSYSFPNTYSSGDLVTNNAASYLTVTAHTTGNTFAGDLSTYWTLIANSAIETSSASVNTASGDGSNKVFTTTYTYTDPKDVQVFVNGALQATNLYSITNSGGNNITFTTAPSSGTNNVIIWGATVVAEAAKAGALTYSTTANNHKITASRWASLTTDEVTDAESGTDSGDYSAKAWAIGGTEVTQTENRGAAKEWAIGTGRIDHQSTGGYSAKEHATGTTVAEGSAKEWATNAGSAEVATSAGYSSKAYAQDDTNDIGSSKDWAMKTSAQVASTDYSSKEWATGTTATSAKDYATKVNGAVTGTDYSSMAWSVGGTGVTETATRGSAKDWATKSDGEVDTAEFSAKAYASLTGSNAPTDGSAKEWATTEDAFVTGSLASAKEYAQGDGNSDAVATGGSAKGWAQDTAKVNGATTNDRSAKAWSQGASMTGATLGGSSKDWATTLVTQIDGTNYSAKENATGVTTTDGSAKQWALGGGSFVEGTEVTTGLYSARKYASDAATAYDNFDDRFLGPHTTAEREVGSENIGKDHDGDALVAGALYFDTTLGAMKVWTGSVWQQTIPSTASQANIDKLATGVDGTANTSGSPGTGNMALINTVVTNLADVNNFATRYRVGSSDPDSSKDDGDLFWNTSTDELKIFNATANAWQVPYLDSASVNAEATNAAISMAIALG